MRHADRSLETIGDLIDALRDWKVLEEPTWYRGQANHAWSLTPSIARSPTLLEAELTSIKLFKQQARPHLPSLPTTEWEWVFLMQHYRAPTRLLDWTERPLVGLYFAVSDSTSDAEDAALWFLDPIALNRHSGHKRAFKKDILAFDIDDTLEQYLPDQVNARKTDLDPVAGIGPWNSSRMVAQAGTFTIMHANPVAVEAVADHSHIWRMVIPAAARASLREELASLGVTESMIFPDLDRIALGTQRLFA